ncbi:hypothetical protein SAMN02745206_00810 [Desulfacinum infernum DSM 9756]|uniref:Uncharacterized protein n=1 Tax=Desulfacinum infernum DSM 9756 TaxID=1121391 RepID=A0A1M4W8X1_9BACT|nr:hypothetical protein [Desulfacinum infernum]SHE77711.1 hypothetical protein SAMN02745206_00810 [Desulfacinum infernum DSM 9756]
MKFRLFGIIGLLAVLLVPMIGSAATVEGTIQGFQCVTQGKTCPVGKEDPVIAVERVFVVLADGGSYFFVSNLDRAVLSRYVNEMVRVEGNLHEKYNSITAEKLHVLRDGKWETRWTREAQEAAWKELQMGM